MEVKIRPAVPEDCGRMMQLIHELAVYERAPDAVTVEFDHFIESGFGKNLVWYALVAEYNGRVEGFALYYIRYSTWKGQCMYLEDFLVSEEMRGHGIGKLLFDRLLELCKEVGEESEAQAIAAACRNRPSCAGGGRQQSRREDPHPGQGN